MTLKLNRVWMPIIVIVASLFFILHDNSSYLSASINDEYYFKTTESTGIYKNENGKLSKVGELNNGQVFKRTGHQTYYHLISFGESTALVKKSDTTQATDNSIRESSNLSKKTILNIYSDAVVYDTSTGKYLPIGTISSGQIYPAILEQSNWWGVDLGGRLGFIHKSVAAPIFQPSIQYFKVESPDQFVYQRIDGVLQEVGKLEEGHTYKRIGDQKYYHLIEFGDKTSFVRKINTVPSKLSEIEKPSSSMNPLNRSIITTQSVEIYHVSSGRYVPIANSHKDQSFIVYAEQANWWIINISGRLGYIHKSAVREKFSPSNRYFKVTNNDSSVYHNINGKLQKVGKLVKGKTYVRAGGITDWHLVEFGKQLGYVKKSSTAPGSKSNIPSLAVNQGNKTIMVNQNTPVFDSSGSFVKIGEVDAGTYFPIVKEQSNFWWINFSGRLAFIYKSAADNNIVNRTSYNLSFNRMLDIQMSANPKRDGAGRYLATRNEVANYLNPSNFTLGTASYYQFLILDRPTNANVNEMNSKFLKNTGSLTGQGAAFSEAAEKHGINEIYLIAHTKHETGNGSSTLASGISRWTKMKPGTCSPVKDSRGKNIIMDISPNKVYNMYGISAYDDCPTNSGAQYAYDKGWTSPAKAIVGGAYFIKNGYINRGQNTLYKMRWNPEYAAKNNTFGPQYATHIAWADIQAKSIANMYNQITGFFLQFDVPNYVNQPSPNGIGFGSDDNNTDSNTDSNTAGNLYPDQTIARTTSRLNLRKDASTNQSPIKVLDQGVKLEIISDNGTGWLKVKEISSNLEGWVSKNYVNILNLYEVNVNGTLNVRSEPSTSGNPVGSISDGELITTVLNSNDEPISKTGNGYEWYQIYYNGNKYWIANDFIRIVN